MSDLSTITNVNAPNKEILLLCKNARFGDLSVNKFVGTDENGVLKSVNDPANNQSNPFLYISWNGNSYVNLNPTQNNVRYDMYIPSFAYSKYVTNNNNISLIDEFRTIFFNGNDDCKGIWNITLSGFLLTSNAGAFPGPVLRLNYDSSVLCTYAGITQVGYAGGSFTFGNTFEINDNNTHTIDFMFSIPAGQTAQMGSLLFTLNKYPFNSVLV